MPDIETEASQDAQIEQEGLDGLPEAERKDTEALLGELSKAGTPEATPDAKKEVEEGDDIPPKKPVEETKPDVEKKPEEEEKPPTRREASVVPAWKLKVAEDQRGRAEKEVADLKLAQEKALEAGGKPTEVAADTEKKLEAIAEKTGIEVGVLKELGSIFAPHPTEDPKIAEALETIERNKQESAAAVEIAQFSADFDKDILPLIKKEYGDASGNVPPETVTKIKDKLAAIAYSPEYAKVPYDEIYNGKKDFRGIIPPPAKGAENSRGGSSRIAEDGGAKPADTVDWKKLSDDPTFAIDDDALKALSPADLDRYFDILDKRK